MPELPAELVGKTPEEIAEYYQERENILQDQLRTARQAPPPRQDPPRKTFDIFNDPEGSVTRTVDERVNERITEVTNVATPGLVAAARMACRDLHPDFGKFAGEIEKTMGGMSPQAQMNPQFWEVAYLTAKGKMADRMVEEAVTRATSPVERPTPPVEAPKEPRKLSAEEEQVAELLGISSDRYRQAGELYANKEGRLPVTVDSRSPRVRRQANGG